MNPPEPEAVYRRLATLLRDQIASGALRPGQRVPTEKDLMAEHGLSRDTVRKALALLRQDGLIVVRHGYPTRVRGDAAPELVRVKRGSRVYARRASAAEARRLGVESGVWVFVLVDPASRETVYALDRTEFSAL